MENKSKQKIKIKKTVFSKIDYKKSIKWSEIDIELQKDDEISAGFSDGFYSENNSMDPHYYFEIIRMVEETDKEFNDRQKRIELDKKWAKERRYESYLKLKKEFENET